MRASVPVLLLVVMFSIAAGCRGTDESGEAPPRLTGEVIASGEYLDSPRRLVVVGDRLVVLDRSAPQVHVFGLPAGTHLGSFGQEGEGPGEYRSARDVQRDHTDPRAFWVYDLSLLRMTRMRFGDAPLPAMTGIQNLHAGGGLYLQPTWLTDSTLVVPGIYPQHPQGRLILTNRDGAFLRTIGETPRHPGAASIPHTVLQHAYEGPVTVRPDRSRFALATRQADRLEIYGSDGALAAQVVGSTGFLPEFETRTRAEGVSMATGDDLRVGYVDLASTGEHIFGLFSGRTRREAGAETFFGDEVHVWDWDGNFVQRLKLDGFALTMAVDGDARSLYAVRHDPEPVIVRYAIPTLE